MQQTVIKEHRRPHNRLGFAVQLSYLRFPGRVWSLGEIVPESVLFYIASQLKHERDIPWNEIAIIYRSN